MNRLLPYLAIVLFPVVAHADPILSFTGDEHQLGIRLGDRPVATYVTDDAKIRRPYFMHLHTPGGVQVTRNHPPVPGKDSTDHDTFHPGLWLSFGDLDKADFWRNKGLTEHVEFRRKKAASQVVWLTSVNQYKDGARVICTETVQHTILAEDIGTWILWRSTFTADSPFTFGDQEEMGLGVRVATPLTVQKGGTIVNSDGKTNEKNAWGKTAEWCSYSGTVDGKKVGVAIFPSPKNFRTSWFHVRDYGLMVANPFGREAFTKGEPSSVTVKPGQPFTLGFGVLIYDGEPDLKAAYQYYLKTID